MQAWADGSRRLCLALTFAQSFLTFPFSISTKLKGGGGWGGGRTGGNTGNLHQNFQGRGISCIGSFFITLPIVVRIKVGFAWVRICSVVGMEDDSANALTQMYSHSVQ